MENSIHGDASRNAIRRFETKIHGKAHHSSSPMSFGVAVPVSTDGWLEDGEGGEGGAGGEGGEAGGVTATTDHAVRPSASAFWNSKPPTIRFAFFFSNQPSLDRLISPRSSTGNSRMASSRLG